MRSAERGSKTVAFRVTNAVTGCYTVRGEGCNMGFGLRSTTATFVYMPHSAVVIRFEKALPLRTREKGGRRERPPPPPQKTRGVMRPATDGVCTRLCTGPHGVAHVLIYPCGKAWKNPLSPRASSCRIGPRRQGFASPLRALDGSGPIRKTRCLRGERGGARRSAKPRPRRCFMAYSPMRLPSTSNRFQSTASIKQSVGDCVSGTGRSRLPAAVLGPCSSPGRPVHGVAGEL